MTGRNCAEVLADLRSRENFRGRIQSIYETAADDSTCYNLMGRLEQVAIVCCSPEPGATRTGGGSAPADAPPPGREAALRP